MRQQFLENKFILVNYHYVEDPRDDFRGIHPCSIEEFERQVVFLAKNYRTASVEEVYKAASSGSSEKICAITFDDGLRDQYKYAVPILKKYNAAATFFPIASTFENILPAVHKMHVLLSRFLSEELIDIFNAYIAKNRLNWQGKYHILKDRRISEKRRLHEDVLTANFKESMFALPIDLKNEFLAFCSVRSGLRDGDIVKELFMNKEEIKNLFDLGFYIGGHSYHHNSLEDDDEDFIEKDTRMTRSYLKECIGEDPIVFSYPHGRYSQTAINILKKEGFRYAVTIDRRFLESGDDPYIIPRYDTNDVRDVMAS